ncbi:MAG: sugar ABC transporter permease [Bacilli bacterium]|nr:sugar ABC transporter permease [Bacilli bacterium]
MTLRIKNKIKENLVGYLLILPLLVSLTVFTIYPLGLALFQSFFTDLTIKRYMNYDWSTFGFQNYINAFQDEGFWHSLRLTFTYAGITVPLMLTLSFLASYALSKDFKGARVFRVLYYLPCLIPGIVSAIIYSYIYAGEAYGFINSLLYSLHIRDFLSEDAIVFFDNELEVVAMTSFISMGLFGIGGSSPFWIAGFKAIPRSYYEAAELDGISKPRIFFKITIPMMSKYIFYQVISAFIGAFQIGQGVLQYTQTAGNGNLNFLGLVIYNTAEANFGSPNIGYASALSYILFVIIGGLTIILFKYNKFVYYEGDN